MYRSQLDSLRFFAIASVMMAHWLQWQWGNWFMTRIPFVHGVILFFVLSGYLITNILLAGKQQMQEAKVSAGSVLKRFYIRRTLRIFPLYYLTILFLLIIGYKEVNELFPWLATYTVNFYQAMHRQLAGYFNHFWSLAVEEQFYIVWPFIILFTPSRHLLKVILLLVAASLAFRFGVFYDSGNWMAVSFLTPSCFVYFCLGALLSYFRSYDKDTYRKLSETPWLALPLLGAYILFVTLSPVTLSAVYKIVLDEVLFAAVAFFIIARAAENNFSGLTRWVMENKLIVHLGKISYALYIFHLFVDDLAKWVLGCLHMEIHNKYLYAGLEFALAVACAQLSWMLLENPIRKFKERF